MFKLLIVLLILQVALKCSCGLRFDLVQNEEEEVQLSVKQGFCPRQFQRQQVCEITCQSDADCSGSLKCCLTDCGGSVCVKPEEGLAQRKIKASVASAQARCPAAVPTKEKSAKVCEACHRNEDCSGDELCCRVAGCSKRSCVKPVKSTAQLANDKHNTLAYDYPVNDYYMNNYNYNNMQLDLNKLSAGNPTSTFEGPLVNIIGTAKTPYLYRQSNPFYKLEKQQYLNTQVPRFNIHPMALKMKLLQNQIGY